MERCTKSEETYLDLEFTAEGELVWTADPCCADGETSPWTRGWPVHRRPAARGVLRGHNVAAPAQSYQDHMKVRQHHPFRKEDYKSPGNRCCKRRIVITMISPHSSKTTQTGNISAKIKTVSLLDHRHSNMLQNCQPKNQLKHIHHDHRWRNALPT